MSVQAHILLHRRINSTDASLKAQTFLGKAGGHVGIFKNRPLVCAAASYLSAFFLCAYASSNVRSILAPLLITLALIAILMLFACRRIRGGISCFNGTKLACLICVIIAASASLLFFTVRDLHAERYDGQCVRLRAVVTEIYADQSEYASFFAKVDKVDGKRGGFAISVFTNFAPDVSVGDVFECDAKLTDIREGGSYYSESSLKRQGLYYKAELESDDFFEVVGEKLTLVSRIRSFGDRLGHKLSFGLSKRSAILAKALLLGDKSELGETVERDFARCGISHILALSGMHITLILGFIMFFLKYLLPQPSARHIVSAFLALFVVLCTGMSASILRAGLMYIYYRIGYILKDRSDIITSLFAVVWTIVLFDPYSILDIGLLLSFAATLGIALFMPAVKEIEAIIFDGLRSRAFHTRILKYVFDSVGMSVSAGMLSSAVAVLFFDELSLLSVFTTLIFTPIIVVFMLCSAVVWLPLPFMHGIASQLSDKLCDTILSLASHFSSLDHPVISTKHISVIIFSLLVFLLLAVFVLRDSKPVVSLAAMTALGVMFFGIFGAVSIFDTFEPRAVLLIEANDTGMVITDGDTSIFVDVSSGSRGVDALATDSIREHCGTDMDVYILTHYHFAHFRALRRLSKSMLVRRLAMPTPQSETDARYARMLELEAERLGIEYEYYESDEPMCINGVTLEFLQYERIRANAHPRLAFGIRRAGTSIVVNAGYDESCEAYESYLDMADIAQMLVTASHGPSAEHHIYSVGRQTIVLADTVAERGIRLNERFLPDGTHELMSLSERRAELPVDRHSVYIEDHISKRRY